MRIRVLRFEGTKKSDGEKFTYWKAIQSNGKKVDCRFTKDCENIPTESCFIEVDEENINLDTTRLYACLWVKKVNAIIPFEKKSVSEYFA